MCALLRRRRARTLLPSFRLWLTCVPELLVAIHGEDHQEVTQDVNDDGEYEEAPQSCGNPRRAVQDGVTGVWRGAVQVGPIYNHCTQSLNFLSRMQRAVTPRLLKPGSRRRQWWDTIASRGSHLHPPHARLSPLLFLLLIHRVYAAQLP